MAFSKPTGPVAKLGLVGRTESRLYRAALVNFGVPSGVSEACRLCALDLQRAGGLFALDRRARLTLKP